MVIKLEPRIVVLAPGDELMAQLRASKRVGDNPHVDRLIEEFVMTVGGGPKSAGGLVTQWEFTVGKNFGYPDGPASKLFASTVGLNFDSIIRVIAPEIAQEAISIRSLVETDPKYMHADKK